MWGVQAVQQDKQAGDSLRTVLSYLFMMQQSCIMWGSVRYERKKFFVVSMGVHGSQGELFTNIGYSDWIHILRFHQSGSQRYVRDHLM